MNPLLEYLPLDPLLYSNDFSSSLDGFGPNGTVTVALSGNRLSATNAAYSARVIRNINTVVGQTYRATCLLDLGTGGTLAFFARNPNTGVNIEVVTANSNGTYTFDFTATSSVTTLAVQNNFAGVRDFYVDDFVAERVTASTAFHSNDFSSTYSGFVSSGTTTLSLDAGRLKASNSSATNNIRYGFLSATGHRYRITCTVDLNASGNLTLYARDITFSTNIVSKTASSNGTYVLEFTALSTSTQLQILNTSGSTRDFYTDDLLIEDITTGGYLADVMQSQDYSPFGVVLDGRHFTVGDDYRYGFQGYEADDEVKGEGNSYTTEFRQYDPRLGRWLSVDPRADKYASSSPYNAFENNPLMFVDTDGDTIIVAGTLRQQRKTVAYLQTLTNDRLILKNGKVLVVQQNAVNCDQKLESGTALIRELIVSKRDVIIFQNTNQKNNADSKPGQWRGDRSNGVGTDVIVNFDYTNKRMLYTENTSNGNAEQTVTPTQITLAHELIHALYMMNGKLIDDKVYATYTYKDVDGKVKQKTWLKEETDTVGLTGNRRYTENKIRKEQGLAKRVIY